MQETLWVVWFIGLLLVVITRIIINRYEDEYWDEGVVYYIINILCGLCIFIVGGIANGKFIGMMLGDLPDNNDAPIIILLTIFALGAAALTFCVGFLVLGLYKLEGKEWAFVIVFVISVIIWSIPCTIYNSNIEVTEETVVVQKQDRKLISFCNIPVQKVSGEVKGSSTLISGHVSGEIQTSDEIPYWYINENNVGLYDCVSAQNSRIIYINEDEVPYVEIISYANQRITSNNNNGKETTMTLSVYKEYYFYIPSSVMQHSVE